MVRSRSPSRGPKLPSVTTGSSSTSPSPPSTPCPRGSSSSTMSLQLAELIQMRAKTWRLIGDVHRVM
uniref:Uncharacterized protein n=1 Tax=Triticum urartu TaxID=4572 RepID=A0A8R7PNU3_TRIUA